MARAKSWHTGDFTFRPEHKIPAALSKRLHQAFPKRKDADAFLQKHSSIDKSMAGVELDKLLEAVELEAAKKKTADMDPAVLRAILADLEAKAAKS